MNFLSLDTSGGYLTVVACKNGEVFSTYLPDCAMKQSSLIMGAVDETLKKADLQLSDCDFFGAVVGAGSFTGIRIGISVAKGFALYMLLSSASVIIGPTLGGLLVSAYGWRTMLWVCVATCVGIFVPCVLTSRKEESIPKMPRSFDRPGAILSLLFFSLLLCLPSFGQNFGWTSKPFLIALIFAMVSLLGLVLVERRSDHPILTGSFIKRRVFLFSVVALFLTQGLMQANMTNTIVFVNYTQPTNTAISGYAISVMYVGMSLGAVILGPLADKVDPKKILLGSFLFTGMGCGLLLLFSEATPVFLFMASLGILGFGLGGNGTIFLKVVLSGSSPQAAGAGTGTYG